MEPTSLSNLPTELICVVLSSTSSAEDLRSLILTSPRIYESFKGAIQSILSAVAHNSLEPQILGN